ncbi:uncharacterized protein PAC_08327 [Phialocephala subalpina]|uniref:Uncharacterized protein n=1 Tax=Phialocephala subalpina TaxID=576137 RepID=A0A1L7X095_9HELO|nr:uncharacterized protein PAC_08327 [Phialocephala subalpina]
MASAVNKQKLDIVDGLFGPTAPGTKTPKFGRDEPATPPWMIGSSVLHRKLPPPAPSVQNPIPAVIAVVAAKPIVHGRTVFWYALIGAVLATTGYYSYPLVSSTAILTVQNVNEGIRQAIDAITSAQDTLTPRSSSPTLSLAPTIAPNGVNYCSPPNIGNGCFSTVTSGDKPSELTTSPDFTILPVTDVNEAANTFKSSELEIIQSSTAAQPLSSSSVATSSASKSTFTSPSKRIFGPKITAKGSKSQVRLLTLYGNLSSILPEVQIVELSKRAVTANEWFWHGSEDARRLNTPNTEAEWLNKGFGLLMAKDFPEVLSTCLQINKENFVFQTDIENILANPDNQALGINLLTLHASAPGWKSMLTEIDTVLQDFEFEIEAAKPILKNNVRRTEQRWKEDLQRENNAKWFRTDAYKEALKKRLAKIVDKLEASVIIGEHFLDDFAKETQELRTSITAGISMLDALTNNRKNDEKLAKKGAEVNVAVLERALAEFVEQRKILEAVQVQLEENVASSESYNGRR